MINHKYKFIFIHIPKTGGTSIEQVFYSKSNKTDVPCKHYTLKMLERGNLVPKDYFKFSFVRNPWDMTVSQYHFMWKSSYPWPIHWRKEHKEFAKLSFEEWVLHPSFQFSTIRSIDIIGNRHHDGTFLGWIMGNKLNIDFIGKFENLQQDFDIICDKIGIPPKKLPHENKTKHKDYREYYDEETKQIVGEKYAKDIEYFGYKFGDGR